MNVSNYIQVLNHIKAHPELWDQGLYSGGKGRHDFIGWAAVFSGESFVDEAIWKVGAKWLGITAGEEDVLCIPHNTIEFFDQYLADYVRANPVSTVEQPTKEKTMVSGKRASNAFRLNVLADVSQVPAGRGRVAKLQEVATKHGISLSAVYHWVRRASGKTAYGRRRRASRAGLSALRERAAHARAALAEKRANGHAVQSVSAGGVGELLKQAYSQAQAEAKTAAEVLVTAQKRLQIARTALEALSGGK